MPPSPSRPSRSPSRSPPRALLFGCGGGRATPAPTQAKQFAAPTDGAGRREGGRLADACSPPRTSTTSTPAPPTTSSATWSPTRRSRPSSATRPATSTPGRCSPPPSPTVSDDGKTITYKLRDDVKFSPPVNRTATAADVKYAIERSLLPGVANGYAQTYLKGITGFDDAVKQAQNDPTGGAPGHQRDHDARRHDAGDQARRHELDRGRGRALAAGRAPRCRRSTRSTTTPRTRRPTASTRSRPVRT